MTSHNRLPWNQQTMLGYFGETCYFVIVSLCYLSINGLFMLLFISLCLHKRAFYQMFRHSIREWEASDANRNNFQFLRKLIQFHISVKRLVLFPFLVSSLQIEETLTVIYLGIYSWFLMSIEVYSRIVMIQLLCSMIMMSCAFFQLDLVSKVNL